jgi:hypothetical protein
VGLGAVAGNWYCETQGDQPRPMGRLKARQSLAAATAACMRAPRRRLVTTGFRKEEDVVIA